jgi:hypothetical protein
VEPVFFPLDEELALLPGSLAPRQQEHLTHLASWMPFDKAAQMIEEILSVQTNEETVRQLSERLGAYMEAAQAEQDDAASSQESTEQPAPQRCAFSADGAMIALVNKQWAETRTVAIGEPQEERSADGEREIHVGHLSYFSRLADASTFTDQAGVEIRRRKLTEARQVCAVMDGADWLQTFTQRHRPDAVRILDFPHAAEHVTQLLEALEKAGMSFPPHILDRCLHILKHRGPRPLLRLADRLERDLAQQKGVQEHLDYLLKREALMQYPECQRHGWPIGSGMVESANKNIVEARLKGPGRHWERKNVNPMLALRNAVCNDRWKEMWQKVVVQHRKLQALQRSARAEQRAQALLAVGNSSGLSSSSPPATASAQLSPSAPCQPVWEAESPPVPLPPLVPQAPQPRSCRLSSRRKRQTARNRVKSCHQESSQVSADVCPCGAPLLRVKGHRSREYCSDRCRQRAHRKRQRPLRRPSPPLLATTPLGSSRPFAPHQRKRGTSYEIKPVNGSPPGSGGVKGETCPCGMPLVQSRGGRMREYCSDRCRQRAHRLRQRSDLEKVELIPVAKT